MKTGPIGTCLGIVLAWALCAQTAAPDRRFEVASVKRDDPKIYEYNGGRPNLPMRSVSGLRVNLPGETIKSLTATAYAIDERLISGPDFVEKEQDLYRVEAVMPAGFAREDIPAMVRTLLQERFHLVAHTIAAERSGYALTVSRKGAKLRAGRAVDDSECPDEWTGGLGGETCRFARVVGDVKTSTRILKDTPNGPILSAFSSKESHTEYYRITMPKLAALLSGNVQRSGFTTPPVHRAYGPKPYVSVVDATGLQGEWDVVVDTDFEDGASLPSVIASLEKQGLTLTQTTIPSEKLVIDRVDRIPTEN